MKKFITKNSKAIFLVVALIVVIGAVAFLLKDIKSNSDTSHQQLEKVRVQAGWLLNGEFANVCTAINRGYYKDVGLEVELIPGGPSGSNFIVATNALAQNNNIDIAIDGDMIPLLRGVGLNDEAKRLQVKMFAAFWQENPYGFLVRKDSGINSIKDFTKQLSNGNQVKLGLTADAVIQYAIAKYMNISVEDLDITKTGFDATPLITGDVDVLGAYWTTQAYELEKAGVEYKFISAAEIPGFDQPSMVALASDKTLKERPEMLKKWLQATTKGSHAVIADPERAATEIRTDKCGGPQFNLAQETWLIKKSIPLFNTAQIGSINEEQIHEFAQTYYDIQQIERVPGTSELVDMSILEAAR